MFLQAEQVFKRESTPPSGPLRWCRCFYSFFSHKFKYILYTINTTHIFTCLCYYNTKQHKTQHQNTPPHPPSPPTPNTHQSQPSKLNFKNTNSDKDISSHSGAQRFSAVQYNHEWSKSLRCQKRGTGRALYTRWGGGGRRTHCSQSGFQFNLVKLASRGRQWMLELTWRIVSRLCCRSSA